MVTTAATGYAGNGSAPAVGLPHGGWRTRAQAFYACLCGLPGAQHKIVQEMYSVTRSSLLCSALSHDCQQEEHHE